MKSNEHRHITPIEFLFPHISEADRFELAITDQVKELSWNQLAAQVLKLANYLRQLDIESDEHIAFQVGNRTEFIELMLAGVVAGVWITPINTHLKPAEAAYILENCEAKILFYDDDNSELANSQQLCEAINICELSQILREYGDIDTNFDQFLVAGSTMLYTSGTTGKPKGVKRAKPDNLGDALQRMRSGGEMFGLVGAGPHLVTGPLYHAAPMLFALYDLLNGAPMIIMPKWDTVEFLNLVERYEIVSTHLVPTMFVRLLNWREEADYEPILGSLQLVLHGAAPIAKTTKLQMLDWWGDVLVEYWGGSEAGTTTLVNSVDWRKHPGTVGKPLDHFQVFIGDQKGNPVNEREGLLFCRHRDLQQVFEYFNDPEKTLKAHPQPHIFCIGDIGYLDSDGFVYLSDRASNMIISGGVNIYPAEIEQALMEHEKVLDCAVFGVPDVEWGEELRAVVQLKSPRTSRTTEAGIKSYLAQKLASYKIPRQIILTDNLPRTATGKVILKELQNLYSEKT